MNILNKARYAMETEISPEYAQRLKKHLSNWLKTADVIYADCTAENLVLALLAYEIENRQRPYVIKRIHSRYSGLRLAREQAEIKQCIETLKLPENTQKSSSDVLGSKENLRKTPKSTFLKQWGESEDSATNGQAQTVGPCQTASVSFQTDV